MGSLGAIAEGADPPYVGLLAEQWFIPRSRYSKRWKASQRGVYFQNDPPAPRDRNSL